MHCSPVNAFFSGGKVEVHFSLTTGFIHLSARFRLSHSSPPKISKSPLGIAVLNGCSEAPVREVRGGQQVQESEGAQGQRHHRLLMIETLQRLMIVLENGLKFVQKGKVEILAKKVEIRAGKPGTPGPELLDEAAFLKLLPAAGPAGVLPGLKT